MENEFGTDGSIRYIGYVVLYEGKFWAMFHDEKTAKDVAKKHLNTQFVEYWTGTFPGWTARKQSVLPNEAARVDE